MMTYPGFGLAQPLRDRGLLDTLSPDIRRQPEQFLLQAKVILCRRNGRERGRESVVRRGKEKRGSTLPIRAAGGSDGRGLTSSVLLHPKVLLYVISLLHI